MGVKILSLFDGMACGMIAMQLAGVEVESYDAYEIDKYAIKTAQHNFPMIKEHGDVFDADFTQYEGVDFGIGGSPCTHWSIAQTKNRETTVNRDSKGNVLLHQSGIGVELFSQFLRMLSEAKPKFFIYENNKSMSKEIRTAITECFGFEPTEINSALVSAQNRQRLYWVGRRNEDGTYSKVNVEQPADRGILLKDVLDNAVARDLTCNDKSYTLTASYDGACAWNTIERHQRNMVAEPINVTEDGKSQTLKAQYCKNSVANFCCYSSTYGASGVAEPVNITQDGKAQCLRATCYKDGIRNIVANEVDKKTGVAEPINDIYLCASGGGAGAKTGLYAVPHDCDVVITENSIRCQRKDQKHSTVQGSHVNFTDGKTQTLSPSHISNIIEHKSDKKYPVYEVRNGLITIKGKQYPIKLKDGYYIIRKLTVSECKRLQTVPEWYEFPVSNSQAYKMLGNGWTCEVIVHLIRSCNGRTIGVME